MVERHQRMRVHEARAGIGHRLADLFLVFGLEAMNLAMVARGLFLAERAAGKAFQGVLRELVALGADTLGAIMLVVSLAIHFNHDPERIGLPLQAADAEPGHAINFSHRQSRFVNSRLQSGAA